MPQIQAVVVGTHVSGMGIFLLSLAIKNSPAAL